MMTHPLDISEELWQLLQESNRDLVDEQDTDLIRDLRMSLNLPEPSGEEAPVTIPTRSSRAAIILEPHDDHYVARIGSMVELPVEIGTRQGVLVVDSDDPLARVQRSIESLEAL